MVPAYDVYSGGDITEHIFDKGSKSLWLTLRQVGEMISARVGNDIARKVRDDLTMQLRENLTAALRDERGFG